MFYISREVTRNNPLLLFLNYKTRKTALYSSNRNLFVILYKYCVIEFVIVTNSGMIVMKLIKQLKFILLVHECYIVFVFVRFSIGGSQEAVRRRSNVKANNSWEHLHDGGWNSPPLWNSILREKITSIGLFVNPPSFQNQ